MAQMATFVLQLVCSYQRQHWWGADWRLLYHKYIVDKHGTLNTAFSSTLSLVWVSDCVWIETVILFSTL